MIVTCESCKSRYKLDDAKITGKGAKITCPKCKNVFVVYAREQSEVTRPAAPASNLAPGTPPVAAPSRDGGRPDASPGLQKGADRKNIGPGVVVAGGSTPAPPTPSIPPRATPEEWEDEPTRVRDSADEHEVVRGGKPAAAPAAPPPPAAPAADVAARAASLDFRKVGVTTWKVKVKIGLIYDFSDIKTLRKYIQDGRVTATDVVSWDGKTWKALGEIPDLDAFFVETWDMLQARREEGAQETTLAPETPRPELAKAIEETPAPTRSGGEPNQFQDPFAELRKKQKDKADLKKTQPILPPPSRPDPAGGSNRSLLLLLLLLLVAGIGGTMWWMDQQRREVVDKLPPLPSSSGVDIKKKIEEDLRDSMKPAPTGTDAADATPVDRPPQAPPQDRAPRAPGIPEGATPIRKPSQATGAPPIQQAEASASDHEAVGDDAARSGDWSTAETAYQKAVSLDKRSAKLMSKLGRAQYEAGSSAAEGTLQRAADMGAKDAYKYLGRLKERLGDPAGAVAAYQQYLKTSPSDQAEIEATLSKLSGG